MIADKDIPGCVVLNSLPSKLSYTRIINDKDNNRFKIKKENECNREEIRDSSYLSFPCFESARSCGFFPIGLEKGTNGYAYINPVITSIIPMGSDVDYVNIENGIFKPSIMFLSNDIAYKGYMSWIEIMQHIKDSILRNRDIYWIDGNNKIVDRKNRLGWIGFIEEPDKVDEITITDNKDSNINVSLFIDEELLKRDILVKNKSHVCGYVNVVGKNYQKIICIPRKKDVIIHADLSKNKWRNEIWFDESDMCDRLK